MELRPLVPAVRRSLFLFLLLSLIPAVPARAVEEKVWVTLEATGAFYDPEQALKDAPGFGLRGAGFLNRWIGIEGMYHQSSPKLESPVVGDGGFSYFGGGLILTPDRYKWTLPYITGGLGSAQVDRTPDAGSSTSESQSAYHFGAGIVARVGERFGFRLDGRGIRYKQQDGPGRETDVHTFLFSGGFTAFFAGKARDTDLDGVPDKKDKCPDSPTGAVVDATGCPVDSDGDKVFDGLDKCPGTPAGAIVDATGCPLDQDKDGVPDGIDQCDSTAAGVVVDAKGCGVDSDKDGVYDGPDKCPGTPEGAVVDASGCPVDSDQDGVADGIDICPMTPAGAAVNAGGCPITPTPYERTMMQDWLIRLTDLAFVPDSSRLLPQGMATLDSVAVAIRQWPMLRFEIGVHVDDQPPPAYRVPLSSQRAQVVARYLLQQSPTLNTKSFSLTGYGDTEPLVKNTSSANRAKNRRVEIKVLNPNVLSEERERRAAFGTTPAPAKEPETPPPPPSGGE